MFAIATRTCTWPMTWLIFFVSILHLLGAKNNEEDDDAGSLFENQFTQLYKKFKPALAVSNSVPLEKWTKSLPNEEEKRQVNDLINYLYPMNNFINVSNTVLHNMFPALSNFLELEVIENNYCVIHEPFESTPGYQFPRFFGVVIIAGEDVVKSRFHHSSPHYQTDGSVHRQAAALFGSTHAKSLVLSGSSRYVVEGKHSSACQPLMAIADAAHNIDVMFHVFNLAIWKASKYYSKVLTNDKALDNYFIQWHGMSESSCIHSIVFLSVGVYPNHTIYEKNNTMAYEIKKTINQIMSSDFVHLPTDDFQCKLHAVNNVFGRVLNGVSEGQECEDYNAEVDIHGIFLHLEQKKVSRLNLTLWRDAFNQLQMQSYSINNTVKETENTDNNYSVAPQTSAASDHKRHLIIETSAFIALLISILSLTFTKL